MKLRCAHNSVRLRVRKSDVQQLAKEHLVEETVNFPGGTCFSYCLRFKNTTTITASLKDNALCITMPTDAGLKWVESNQVGFELHVCLEGDEKLHLLIEKDFPCLHRPHEDKKDTFQELAGGN